MVGCGWFESDMKFCKKSHEPVLHTDTWNEQNKTNCQQAQFLDMGVWKQRKLS